MKFEDTKRIFQDTLYVKVHAGRQVKKKSNHKKEETHALLHKAGMR